MFEKKQIKSENQIGTEIDFKSVIHTMKDDLAILEGKKIEELPIIEENLLQEQKQNNNITIEDSSPFSEQYSTPPSPSNIVSNPVFPVNENLPGFALQKEKKVESEELNKPSKSNFNRVFLLGGLVLIILIFAGGGYFFWITRSDKNEDVKEDNFSLNNDFNIENNNESDKDEKEPVQIETPDNKFSVDKPNYLRMDIENLNAESAKNFLIQTGEDVKKELASSPIEFKITDNSNNPISFSAWALLLGINLPKTIMNQLEPDFSFYCYIDEGRSRLGIAVNIKNNSKENLTSIFRKEEINLHKYLHPLILEDVKKAQIDIYKDNQYKNYNIRYFNFDKEKIGITSIDYALTDKHLIIGTSKNTMWAMVDKIDSLSK